MKLLKWYMDFIDEEGQTCLGYAAKLNFMGMSLGYSAILQGSMKKTFIDKYSLKYKFPVQIKNEYRWVASPFDCIIKWEKEEGITTVPVVLWDSKEGSVVWDNILPRAESQMNIGVNKYKGRGYIECLTMDITPWKLPIKILRWGRFVSEKIALVWIHWSLKDQGERQWLFLDGKPVDMLEINKEKISWKEGELKIFPGQTIRKGLLKDTAFSSTPSLKLIFPKSVLNINEYKQLAPGELKLKSGALYEGWIIDETVIF